MFKYYFKKIPCTFEILQYRQIFLLPEDENYEQITMDFVPTLNSVRMRHVNNVRKHLLLTYVYLPIISQMCMLYIVEW